MVTEAQTLYELKCKLIGEQNQKQLEKGIMLQTIDMLWKEHLAAMDYMRLGIGLQGYAQRNPKNEYKIQSFNLFTKLLDNIKYQVIKLLSRVQIQMRPPVERNSVNEMPSGLNDDDLAATDAATDKRALPEVGRSDPCPCGSGKKYKDCCGKAD